MQFSLTLFCEFIIYSGDTATCLHNAPHEDSALGRALPGTLLSLDAQCRRDRGTYACFKDERVCAQLFCFDAQTGYCVAYRPAAEGSTCGSGLVSNCSDECFSNKILHVNYKKEFINKFNNKNTFIKISLFLYTRPVWTVGVRQLLQMSYQLTVLTSKYSLFQLAKSYLDVSS